MMKASKLTFRNIMSSYWKTKWSIFRVFLPFSAKIGNIAMLKQLVEEKQVPVDTTDYQGQ